MPLQLNRAERCARVVTREQLQKAIIPQHGDIDRGARPRVGRLFRRTERELFKTEGESGGEEWADLTDNPPGHGYKSWKDRFFGRATAFVQEQARRRGKKLTKAQVRKALGAENKKLELYGDLMRSLTTENAEHIERYVPLGEVGGIIEMGTLDPVASYHWEGKPPLVVRNPIQHTEEQNRAYGEVIREWLEPWRQRGIEVLRRSIRAQRLLRALRA